MSGWTSQKYQEQHFGWSFIHISPCHPIGCTISHPTIRPPTVAAAPSATHFHTPLPWQLHHQRPISTPPADPILCTLLWQLHRQPRIHLPPYPLSTKPIIFIKLTTVSIDQINKHYYYTANYYTIPDMAAGPLLTVNCSMGSCCPLARQ